MVEPLLLTTTGKEHIVSKDRMKGTVNVKSIANDTIEIEENDYYLFLALLHASEDNVLPFEEPELDADDDLNEREDKTDKQSNRPKRGRRTAATAAILFPEAKSRETLRFEGNKIHCSPRDQSLSDLLYSKANGSNRWKTNNHVIDK